MAYVVAYVVANAIAHTMANAVANSRAHGATIVETNSHANPCAQRSATDDSHTPICYNS